MKAGFTGTVCFIRKKIVRENAQMLKIHESTLFSEFQSNPNLYILYRSPNLGQINELFESQSPRPSIKTSILISQCNVLNLENRLLEPLLSHSARSCLKLAFEGQFTGYIQYAFRDPKIKLICFHNSDRFLVSNFGLAITIRFK